VVHEASAQNGQRSDQEIKDQSHRRPKLNLEAWRRHHCRFTLCFKKSSPFCFSQ